jgi:hypothetical protein
LLIDFFKINNIATSDGDLQKIESNGKILWQKPGNTTTVTLIWNDGYGESGERTLYSDAPNPQIQVHSGGGTGTAVVFGSLMYDINYEYGFFSDECYSEEGNNVFCSVSAIAKGLGKDPDMKDIDAGVVQTLLRGRHYTYYVIF